MLVNETCLHFCNGPWEEEGSWAGVCGSCRHGDAGDALSRRVLSGGVRAGERRGTPRTTHMMPDVVSGSVTLGGTDRE